MDKAGHSKEEKESGEVNRGEDKSDEKGADKGEGEAERGIAGDGDAGKGAAAAEKGDGQAIPPDPPTEAEMEAEAQQVPRKDALHCAPNMTHHTPYVAIFYTVAHLYPPSLSPLFHCRRVVTGCSGRSRGRGGTAG